VNAKPAKITRNPDGHRYWSCPNCSRTIGEIMGERLVVLVKRDLVASFRITGDLVMVCMRCHTSSTLLESDAIKPTPPGR
jgi:hypothetical protein